MKKSQLLLCLLALSLGACKSKKIVEKIPPPLYPLNQTEKNMVPNAYQGQWENCQVIGQKSLHTQVEILGSMKIRETTYKDEFCQLIDSTRERTAITYYSLEYDPGLLRGKVLERKLVHYNAEDVAAMNKEGLCGWRDWVAKEPKNVLGTPCQDLPRDNKYDLTTFQLKFEDQDSFLLQGLKLSKAVNVREDQETGIGPLVNETTSEVVQEKGSKNVMLVLPPKSGTFKLAVETTGITHKRCAPILNTFNTSVYSTTQMESLKTEISKEKARLNDRKENINKAISDLMEYVEANGLQEYDDLKREYEEKEEALAALELDYRSCELNCEGDRQKIRVLKNELREARSKISSLRTARRLTRGYSAHVKNITWAETEYEKQRKAILIKERQLRDAEDRMLTLFDHIDEKDEVAANISFEGAWASNLRALVQANPGVKFRKADIRNIVMSYRLQGPSNYPAHTSIQIFPGLETSTLVKGRFNLKQYPATISGPTKVSLLAACPAMDPESYGLILKRAGMIEFDVQFSYQQL